MSIFSPIGTGKHADACGNANVGRVLGEDSGIFIDEQE